MGLIGGTMRRVIDDTHLEEIANEIMLIIKNCPADEVSEYEWGSYRITWNKLVPYIFDRVTIPVKLGNNRNTTGIGNNWKKELIYTGDEKEEQICGILCLTDGMYGDMYAYITDIDGNRVGGKRTLYGCNPKDEYSIKINRFRGWNE